MPASLIFTAQVAVTIRKAVNTKLEDTPTPKKLPPFKPFHYSLWSAPLPSSGPAALMLWPCLSSRCDKDEWAMWVRYPLILKMLPPPPRAGSVCQVC